MCTAILLSRPGHRWPILLAANRDERLDRSWDPPAAHWPEEWPGVVAGRDRLAGGSWMAMGPHGVVAAVLNRPGSLGPAPDKRSRGALPLLAAAAPDAAAAVARVAALAATDYRPFNMVVVDPARAFFLRGLGHGHPECSSLARGVTVVTAQDPNDPASPRVRRHLPRFRAAAAPDPDSASGWNGWEELLADDAQPEPGAALRVPPTAGFGTVCSSLIGLSADGRRVWRFADGPAGTVPFRDVRVVPPAAAPLPLR